MDRVKFFFRGVLVLFLTGCGVCESRYDEGQNLLSQISEELTEVHSLEELRARQLKLSELWTELAEVMVELSHKPLLEPFKASPAGKRLVREMERIYAIEGARSLMESSQREALILFLKQETLSKD